MTTMMRNSKRNMPQIKGGKHQNLMSRMVQKSNAQKRNAAIAYQRKWYAKFC